MFRLPPEGEDSGAVCEFSDFPKSAWDSLEEFSFFFSTSPFNYDSQMKWIPLFVVNIQKSDPVATVVHFLPCDYNKYTMHWASIHFEYETHLLLIIARSLTHSLVSQCSSDQLSKKMDTLKEFKFLLFEISS